MFVPRPGMLEPGPMQPYATIGQNLLIKVVQNYVLFRVNLVEQLPLSSPMVVNFASGGAIAANSTTPGVSLQTPLQMDGFEIGQFRAIFLEDFDLQVYEPQNTPRFINSVGRYRWSMMAQSVDPDYARTEIAVYQNQYPYVDVINPTAVALNMARIAFFGNRYRIERLKDAQGQQYPAFATIGEVPTSVPYQAIMAEGFTGLGFERIGL